ncbi:RHS repeat-associated core domain-containing protein [Loktanella agnita]|uniref:RHS repeat-associated core domain-containing protein n=1 Tax=Loktanella agnita TaxID=287097 RepID=UPI003985BD73
MWGNAEKIDIWRGEAANGGEVTCQIRFQGQWADEESGLHYNRFRYYDAEAGQYLLTDPLGLSGGTRPQGYVTDPNNWIDPFGLASCPVRVVNDTPIYGKGQRDGTPGHDQFSEVIANKLAMSGKFREIHMNHQYNSGVGPGQSRRRPDVMAIDHNGRVHSIELASKTDMGRKLPDLTTRNNTAMNRLPPNQRGEVVVLEHPYKSALDNLIGGI